MDITIIQTRELIPLGCSLIAYSLDGKRVGHAHISLSDNVATLADIIVISRSESCFFLSPYFKRKKCYRNRGIGSKLLKNVIALCKSSNISILNGNMHGEIDKLKSWYSLHGFAINGNQITLRVDTYASS
jgi:GNAT superfamily N-acetyltransferase